MAWKLLELKIFWGRKECGACVHTPQVACLTVFHISNTFTTQVAHLTHWPAPLTMLYNTHSPSQSSIKLILAGWKDGCNKNTNKAQSGLFKQVVTNTGCTKLNHLHCIKIHQHDLRKGDNLRHTTKIGYKILLHTITFFVISLEPMVVPPQKFYQQ